MKKVSNYILLTLTLNFAFVFISVAQVSFKEVGLGTSYWLRIYNTPDETSVLANGSLENGDPSGVIVPNLFGVLELNKSFALRGSVGLAQKKYESRLTLGELNRTEQIKQTIIPVGLNLEYRIPLSKKNGENSDEEGDQFDTTPELLLGVGVNRFFIQHDINRSVINGEGTLPPTRFSGNDFGVNFMMGVYSPLSKSTSILIFARYNNGEYNHKVYQDNSPGIYSIQNISLRGFEFGVAFGFILP